MTAKASRIITIAAAAFIDRDGNTLLVRKRGFEAFMQPGGKIDAGETPREALIRELQEELALEVSAADFTYAGMFTEDAANEPNMLVKAHVFTSRLPVRAKACAEIAEARWFSLEGEPDAPLARLTETHILPLARRVFADNRLG